jgi:hypothetical protein
MCNERKLFENVNWDDEKPEGPSATVAQSELETSAKSERTPPPKHIKHYLP